MLKADVLGEGRLKFYDDQFDGYHVLVEKKSMDFGDGTESMWGMVYLVLPEDGPQALDHREAVKLADALAGMLEAAADMARLMNNE